MKYRIWSTIDKKYVSNTRNLVLDVSGKIRALGGVTMNPELGMVAEMQTGIKDKNGKEIYEGDIVSYWKMPETVRNFGSVQFEAPYYTVGGTEQNCHYRLKNGEDLEIVGNIHL